MRGKVIYLFGYSLGFAIETGVIATVIYHINKLVVWVEIASKPMRFGDAFWIGLTAVGIVEIYSLLKKKPIDA